MTDSPLVALRPSTSKSDKGMATYARASRARWNLGPRARKDRHDSY